MCRADVQTVPASCLIRISQKHMGAKGHRLLQAAEEMLQESGLQELEQRVLGFLCTNSGSLKLLSTLDDAQRLLHQVQSLRCNSIWTRWLALAAGLYCHLETCNIQWDRTGCVNPTCLHQVLAPLAQMLCTGGLGACTSLPQMIMYS